MNQYRCCYCNYYYCCCCCYCCCYVRALVLITMRYTYSYDNLQTSTILPINHLLIVESVNQLV